jgi:hypothetical protein
MTARIPPPRWEIDTSAIDLDLAGISPTIAELTARHVTEQVRRHDQAVMQAAFGVPGRETTANAWAEQEPLTTERLAQLIDAMPPRHTWVSWDWFEGPEATIVNTPREILTIAGPRWWRRAMAEIRAQDRRRSGEYFATSIYDHQPEPISVDPDPEDTPDRAEWRAQERSRVVSLLRTAVEDALGVQARGEI